MDSLNVNNALVDLINAGADIEKIGENSFLVTDNGFLGLLEDTDPFVIDEEDLLEMHEIYCENK
jgi:hypothetical protein